MTTSKTNPKVDAYMARAKKWPEESRKLRQILLGCGLAEEFKWGKPTYAFEGKNIVAINQLKDHSALLFFKGALIPDDKGVLIKPGENSQSARWMKFTSAREIARMEPVLKAYVREAVEAEKAGLKVEPLKSKDLILPEELKEKFNEVPGLKAAFKALTPGRQRAYVLYFSGAKQSKTRTSRIGKYERKILAGKGMND